ncbi:hypothetical protein AC249_AIPGENE18080 [Exaiptasia diaphana]|nr:hypothetical protein AC249_AIPGENE18080 [Exaiptasia diaphana]
MVCENKGKVQTKTKKNVKQRAKKSSVKKAVEKLSVTNDGSTNFDFYKKKAKKPLFVNYRSWLPRSSKVNFIMNERKRIKQRCISTNTATKRDLEFDEILKGNGYPPNFINETKLEAKQRTMEQHHPNDTNPDKWLYFSIPYISDSLDRRLKNIFRKEGLNVRIAHKSQTMRNALKRPVERYTCKIDNCPVAESKKCFQRGVVYEITCAKCGSTCSAKGVKFS